METRYSRLANPLLSGSWLRPATQREGRGGDARKRKQLTEEESARLLRIVSGSSLISSHYDVLQWLNGEIQHFLPHEILLSAWGDFAKWNLQFDVVSEMAGVRTAQLARCPLDGLIKDCYDKWSLNRRQPLVVKLSDLLKQRVCTCSLHVAVHDMRWLLVHGSRDERNHHESLYIAFSATPLSRHIQERAASLAYLLVPQIDVAVRKVAALTLAQPRTPGVEGGNELSAREREVLQWLKQGKSNCDIGAVLDISPFTVKNHMQRIFRKLGASNRTEAVAKYSQTLPESASAAF